MRRHGLQARFLSIVLVGATAFAALAGAFAYALGHARAVDGGQATLDGLAAAVRNTAAIGAYAGDRVLLQEVAQGVARNPLVARVEIIGAEGQRLASEADPGRETASGLAVDSPLASPFDPSETVGRLRIVADVDRLEAAARREASVFALLMVAQTALVALLLYGVAARFVSRPIVRLAASLRAMPPGTAARLATPEPHQRDEIGDLIGGANDLLQANEVALRRERQLRAEIEAMEAQYRQIFDSSSAGIFVLDGSGRLIDSNPTALRVIGLPLPALKALNGDAFVRQVFAQPERVRAMMDEAAERGGTVSADLELRRGDPPPRWMHCLISRQGQASGQGLIEGVMYDITERKRTESATLHQAEHDALTGLHNRQGSDAAIDRLLADAAAAGVPLSVVYIDLDGFKQINDELGHKSGDQVLQHCALRMRAVVSRTGDVVARIGGDEFVLVLSQVGPSDPGLARTALLLLERLSEPIVLDDGQRVHVGASLGLASYPRHGTSRKQLFQAADAAMYEVKRHGKNSVAMALSAAAAA